MHSRCHENASAGPHTKRNHQRNKIPLYNFSTMNSTATNNESCILEPPQFHINVLPWFYLSLALLGFVANGLALLDLWRQEKTATVIFTLNIVVSDLMVCSSFLVRMAYYRQGLHWEAGSTVCNTTEFLMVSCFYINLYCNMCFLLWISINRYATVVRPHCVLFQAFKRPLLCWVVCLVTWMGGVFTMTGILGYKALTSKRQNMTCFDQVVNQRIALFRSVHSTGVGVFFFILGLMLVSYGLLIFHLQKVRGGSLVGAGFGPGGGLRVRRKILASVILFIACFLPYHVQRIRMMAASRSKDCQREKGDFNLKILTILVAALSCCLHPMLHLVLRLPCCRAKRNVRTQPKLDISKSQVTPHIHTVDQS